MEVKRPLSLIVCGWIGLDLDRSWMITKHCQHSSYHPAFDNNNGFVDSNKIKESHHFDNKHV